MADQAMNNEQQTSFVTTRAGRVAYSDTGTNVPIVLLHATLHTRHDFDPIIPPLAERYRVIALDWPWHGESEGLPAPHLPSAVLLADVLEDFITVLDLPPAIFIGNSVGGFAASRLAITQPERVRGLILVNNGGFIPMTVAPRTFCHVLGTPFLARHLLPHLVSRYMSAQTLEDEVIVRHVQTRSKDGRGSEVAAAMWRSFLDPGHDLRERGKAITAPTLIVWGVRDPLSPISVGRETQTRIPGARLEEFQTGHVVFSSKPVDFLALVQEFIEGVRKVEGTSSTGDIRPMATL